MINPKLLGISLIILGLFVIITSLFFSREFGAAYIGEGPTAEEYGRAVFQIIILLIGPVMGIMMIIGGFFLRAKALEGGKEIADNTRQ